jgi:hypothetical protein
MSDPHIIRLRDPWEAERQNGDVTLWRRRFNRPTGLSPGDQVFLVIQSPTDVPSLRLNDVELPISAHRIGAVQAEIVSRLDVRNTIEILAGAQRDFEVWLEIFSR